jgi:hypothetical protein
VRPHFIWCRRAESVPFQMALLMVCQKCKPASQLLAVLSEIDPAESVMKADIRATEAGICY